MIIRSRNTLAENAGKTYLTYAESAGTNVLRWQNSSQFSNSWGIQLGETGQEQTEVVVLGTADPAGTAGTLTANDLYEHPADTPVYAIKYDQVVFKRSATGTAGTALAMADGTVTIQADSQFTQFDDTTGSVSYAYKTAFRSSVLAVNSTESDWIISTVPFYTLMSLRQRVKDKLWDSSFVTDGQVDDWLNEWLDEMNNVMVDVNEDYALGSVDISFSGTAELGTITSTDFKTIRRVWMTTDGTDWYNATKTEITRFLPNQEFNRTNPYYFMFGDNIIGRRPHSASGTASLIYYKLSVHMDDDMDEIPTPMRSYTKSFVDYGLGQALFKDGKKGESTDKLAEAYAAKDRFKKELTPRLQSGNTIMDIVEDLGQDTMQELVVEI